MSFNIDDSELAIPETAFECDEREQDLFQDPSDELLWMALLICGDPVRAEQAIVKTREAALSSANPVLRDWLFDSAAHETTRVAVEEVRNAIFKSGAGYSAPAHSTGYLDPLDEVQIDALYSVPVERVIHELDTFARCVLVMRGVLEVSISECARLTELSREHVIAAYCRTLGWLRFHQHSELEFGGDAAWEGQLAPAGHEYEHLLA